MAKQKITCIKCGRAKEEREFFKMRTGDRYPLCKDCLTMYIDNRKPSTFKWILEKFDVPYVEKKWVELTNREYLKNPSKFNSKSVIGLYIRSMNMNQWAQYRYADSDKLNSNIKGDEETRREFIRNNNNDEELKRRYEAGEMSEAEYRTLLSDQTILDEPEPHQELEDLSDVLYTPSTEDDPDLCKVKDPYARLQSIGQAEREIVQERVMEEEEPLSTPDPPEEEEVLVTAIDSGQEDDVPGFVRDVTTINEEDIQDQLTEDDIKYLALKWGLLYKPSEWVKMEEMYRKYESSYEISIDREQALKAICKTDLKMNQAIDLGDTKTFKDLQTANDQLRKSAKFNSGLCNILLAA